MAKKSSKKKRTEHEHRHINCLNCKLPVMGECDDPGKLCNDWTPTMLTDRLEEVREIFHACVKNGEEAQYVSILADQIKKKLAKEKKFGVKPGDIVRIISHGDIDYGKVISTGKTIKVSTIRNRRFSSDSLASMVKVTQPLNAAEAVKFINHSLTNMNYYDHLIENLSKGSVKNSIETQYAVLEKYISHKRRRISFKREKIKGKKYFTTEGKFSLSLKERNAMLKFTGLKMNSELGVYMIRRKLRDQLEEGLALFGLEFSIEGEPSVEEYLPPFVDADEQELQEEEHEGGEVDEESTISSLDLEAEERAYKNIQDKEIKENQNISGGNVQTMVVKKPSQEGEPFNAVIKKDQLSGDENANLLKKIMSGGNE